MTDITACKIFEPQDKVGRLTYFSINRTHGLYTVPVMPDVMFPLMADLLRDVTYEFCNIN
jgi:hypothetical protein